MTDDPARLTHFDDKGHVRQVDVTDKQPSARVAVAKGVIRVAPQTLKRVRESGSSKGDPLEVARVAAVMAAKKTPDLIPLSHSVPLSQLDLEAEYTNDGIELTATAKTVWTTGVEMEALTAVSVAALTVYDMLKSLDKSMSIEHVRLVRKSGGKSGDYERED